MKTKEQIGLWLSWTAVVLWMAVIFAFSAQTGAQSGGLSGGVTEWVVSHLIPGWDTLSAAAQAARLDVAHLLLRKAAHMTEFAILGGLLMNAWTRKCGRAGWFTTVAAALCGLLYAIGDELHQMFVPERGPAVTDVLIDFGGVLLGVGLVWLIVRRKRR